MQLVKSMMAGLYVLIILCLRHLNVINAELLNPLQNNYEKHQCNPNEVYKAKNITCVCTDKGEWPNDECHIYFQTLKNLDQTCEPNKFIIIDCNVCRCDHNGKVNKDQCTQHECDVKEKFRRSNSIEGSCNPKRWYSLAPCRICYCVNKDNLICNNENIISKIRLGKYELSECSDDLLLDMKEITSGKRALRFGKKEMIKNQIYEYSSVESDEYTQEIEEDNTTKHDKLIANENKAKSKVVKEENYMQYAKSKVKESKVNKVNSVIDWNNSSNRNQTHVLRIKLPNVFDNILNLVLRKSLSLNSGNKCKPGSTTKVGCNSSFCLTNGKLLCTEKQCK